MKQMLKSIAYFPMKFFKNDKVAHFWVFLGIFFISWGIGAIFTSFIDSMIVAMFITVVLAALKEAADRWYWDATADFIDFIAGVAFPVVITFFILGVWLWVWVL